MYEYNAEVLRVVDGDTVHARVDLGLDIRADIILRLYGINTPELPTTQAVAARDYLASRLAEVGFKVRVETIKDHKEKYGRYLAVLWIDAESLNDTLVRLGYAVAKTY